MGRIFVVDDVVIKTQMSSYITSSDVNINKI